MADPLTEADSNKLFNEVSQAMQADDNVKLSSLLAQETPTEEQPTQDPPEEEEQPEEIEGKETEESPLTEEEDGADEPKEDKEPTEAEKQLEELRAQLETAKRDNQALRSQAGRVPSIQRKLAEVDKKLAELTTLSPSSQASTKVKPKVEKLLEGIKETDPALADSIAQALGVAIEGVDEELRESQINNLKAERELAAQDYLEEQRERLLSVYPNAPEVFASPHWAEWKKSQPAHIQALAGSDSADAVVMAFELYAKAMTEKYPELGKTKEEAKSTPVENEEAKKLEEARLRKKKDSVDMGTSRAAARDKEPTDPQALFEKFSQEIAKELKGN